MSDVRCPHDHEGMRCDLTTGHDGPHHASRDLPPDVGAMIDAAMTRLEAEHRRLRRGMPWYYAGLATLWLIVAVDFAFTVVEPGGMGVITAAILGAAAALGIERVVRHRHPKKVSPSQGESTPKGTP